MVTSRAMAFRDQEEGADPIKTLDTRSCDKE